MRYATILACFCLVACTAEAPAPDLAGDAARAAGRGAVAEAGFRA